MWGHLNAGRLFNKWSLGGAERLDEPTRIISLFQSYRCSQFCPERRAISDTTLYTCANTTGSARPGVERPLATDCSFVGQGLQPLRGARRSRACVARRSGQVGRNSAPLRSIACMMMARRRASAMRALSDMMDRFAIARPCLGRLCDDSQETPPNSRNARRLTINRQEMPSRSSGNAYALSQNSKRGSSPEDRARS